MTAFRCLLAAALAVALLVFPWFPADAGESRDRCIFKSKKLYGRVMVTDMMPDFRVMVVNSYPDLRVQKVVANPYRCGQWQFVDHRPDFTIQYVDSLPELRVQFVSAGPGRP